MASSKSDYASWLDLPLDQADSIVQALDPKVCTTCIQSILLRPFTYLMVRERDRISSDFVYFLRNMCGRFGMRTQGLTAAYLPKPDRRPS